MATLLRRSGVGLLTLALAVPTATAGCGDDLPQNPAGTTIEGRGAADQAWFSSRKLAYARFETVEWNPTSLPNVLAHLTRKRLEPGYVVPGVVSLEAWDGYFQRIDDLRDGRDFFALDLLAILLGHEKDPAIPPALIQKTDDVFLRFKYWFTHPTPPGKADDSYYWSENHQISYYVVEYFAGLRFLDRPIGTDARLGREHALAARKQILKWLDLRARFGFSEWHSNVYYEKDISPLLLLVEHTRDEEIRARASAVLDILFADLALHTLRDAFGVTHGRSYKKDKMTSTDEDTWGITKLLFDSSTYDFVRSDGGAGFLAANTRYVLPEIIRLMAADKGPLVDRERMSLPIQESLPLEDEPQAAYGLSYTNPDDLMVWWGMGALTAYPVVPQTLEAFHAYNLWDSSHFEPFKDLRTISPLLAVNLSVNSSTFLNFALMKDVDTYTWRTGDVMLSSAIDFRKGTFNQQMHSWQATLDAKAIVFTNHPFRALATSGDWRDDPERGGYWNGEASAPRSAQFENVGIHIYAPQYPQQGGAPFEYFHWEPYTHAYFPQEFFDEIAQDGNWTFGRKGDGYVGLYSHRPPKYLVYDGVKQATGGRTKPFDLVAEGGADNVWIVECGTKADGPFTDWTRRLAGVKVEVTSRGPGEPTGESDGFDVVYLSPKLGIVSFGWDAPLVVSGREIPLHATGRYENPYAQTPLDPKEIVFEKNGVGLRFDTKLGKRVLFGPP